MSTCTRRRRYVQRMSTDKPNGERRNMAALLLGATGACMLNGCALDEPPPTGEARVALAGGGVIDLASSMGIAPSNTPGANDTAFLAWAASAAFYGHTLVFDQPGGYEFGHETHFDRCGLFGQQWLRPVLYDIGPAPRVERNGCCSITAQGHHFCRSRWPTGARWQL